MNKLQKIRTKKKPNPNPETFFSLAEIKENTTILAKFHPEFWQEGAWLCCRQVEKLAPGCAEYNPCKDSKDHTTLI